MVMTDQEKVEEEYPLSRECPECGEVMVREHWTGYGLGDQYKWYCRDCGAERAGGEEPDSELFPYPFD